MFDWTDIFTWLPWRWFLAVWGLLIFLALCAYGLLYLWFG